MWDLTYQSKMINPIKLTPPTTRSEFIPIRHQVKCWNGRKYKIKQWDVKVDRDLHEMAINAVNSGMPTLMMPRIVIKPIIV